MHSRFITIALKLDKKEHSVGIIGSYEWPESDHTMVGKADT